jgi:hypothetical protein
VQHIDFSVLAIAASDDYWPQHVLQSPPACYHADCCATIHAIYLMWLYYTRYPDLDEETSPAGILRTLTAAQLPRGSVLYIATNEPKPLQFFAPLKQHYSIYSVTNLPHAAFRDPRTGSYNYLPSTLALIDYAVIAQCVHWIPTFASERGGGLGQGLSLSKSIK